VSESFLDNYVLAVAIVFHQLLGYNTHMVVAMNRVNMGQRRFALQNYGDMSMTSLYMYIRSGIVLNQ